MKILVTGGCGYKGSVLIPSLLADGHTVTSIDTQWFGNLLPEHKNLINLQMDVRDTEDTNEGCRCSNTPCKYCK